MTTRRERVRAALSHHTPDRVPLDLGGMGSTGITGAAYSKLLAYWGASPTRPVHINDFGQQLAEPDQDVLEIVGADVINIGRSLAPCMPNLPIKRMDFPVLDRPTDMLADGLEIEREADRWVLLGADGKPDMHKPDSADYFSHVRRQMSEAQTIGDIAQFKWPAPNLRHLKQMRRRAEWLRANTDYALMASFGGNILEQGQSLRGWEQFMLDLAYGGAFRDYLLDFIANQWLDYLGPFMEAVGDLVDVVVFGDDLGTQAGLQLSADLYRATIHPRRKRLCRFVREHWPEVGIFLHSCGSIRPLIPMLIDEGIQILNPVQTNAHDMDAAELKREFGRDIVFWGGGVDTQGLLSSGTPEAVRADTLQRLKIFSQDGGFVFCQIHNIQANMPPANITAMYNAVREFNGQPPIPERPLA
jgi:uroporphyrinogen decarboxylase